MDHPEYNRENLAALLRKHDIGPTHQRIEIAHALYSRWQHLSAEQILSIVNEQHNEVSKATVYNTLKLFLEKGLIRQVIVDPERVFYDPNTIPHYHFYNTQTRELTDVCRDNIKVTGLPTLPTGMVMEDVDIIVHMRPDTANCR